MERIAGKKGMSKAPVDGEKSRDQGVKAQYSAETVMRQAQFEKMGKEQRSEYSGIKVTDRKIESELKFGCKPDSENIFESTAHTIVEGLNSTAEMVEGVLIRLSKNYNYIKPNPAIEFQFTDFESRSEPLSDLKIR